MNKNWLIRTKSNHILGPISKDKILELYHNGSIKPEDEVCCGNGYWFFIREESLVSKFLLGDEIQSFNPVSESLNVLSAVPDQASEKDSAEDITLIQNLNGAGPDNATDSDYQSEIASESGEMMSNETGESLEMESIMLEENKKKSCSETNDLDESEDNQPKLKKQGWLKYLLIFLFIILIFLVYFRIKILRYISGEEVSFLNIIQESHAQDFPSKKKMYLINT